MRNLNSSNPPGASEAARLEHVFFARPPQIVAQELLGCGLAHWVDGVWMGGWIVETEAYLAVDDPACHSARGQTKSNSSMFAAAGTLYVYPIHGRYCLNFATEDRGVGSAVLVRALQPAWGIDAMMRNRGTADPRRLTSGPGMICQAMQVSRTSDAIDPLAADAWAVFSGRDVSVEIIASPRIGIREAAELPLRYFVNGNRYVSGLARLHTRPRRDQLG